MREENIPSDYELSEEQFREKYEHLEHKTVDRLWRHKLEEIEDYEEKRQKKEKKRKKRAEREEERLRKIKNLNQNTAKVIDIYD